MHIADPFMEMMIINSNCGPADNDSKTTTPQMIQIYRTRVLNVRHIPCRSGGIIIIVETADVEDVTHIGVRGSVLFNTATLIKTTTPILHASR